jgi:hypothetical protein
MSLGEGPGSLLELNEPCEIPGGVLEPGRYVLRIVRDDHSRTVVRVMKLATRRVRATLLTVVTQRPRVATHTEYTFIPTGDATVRRALRSWSFRGSSFGQELVYPSRRTRAFQKAAATARR